MTIPFFVHILYIQRYTVYIQMEIAIKNKKASKTRKAGGICMEKILQVDGLQKQLGDFRLEDIRFDLEPGYIMGMIGVNGAGKTTLMKTLLQIYRKEKGKVHMLGMDMEHQEKEIKNKLGIVMDNHLYEDKLTVKQNGFIYGSFYSQFDKDLFLKYCEAFSLPLNKKLGKLSLGMQMRFQIAFALSHQAELFLLDEPEAGLDPAFRKELLKYMQDIVEDGTRSVLFSTHITEDLDKIADYITMLHNGKVLFSKSKEELYDSYFLVEGEKNRIEAIPEEICIGKEYGEFHSTACLSEMPSNLMGLKRKNITIEEIMYYLVKGGKANDSINTK